MLTEEWIHTVYMSSQFPSCPTKWI